MEVDLLDKPQAQEQGPNSGQAMVLSGGGARAAYQVGCLRALGHEIPHYRPQILTGVSAGAINAAHLASFRGSWQQAVDTLAELWGNMATSKVYRTDLLSLMQQASHWGLRFASGGRLGRADIRGMVDNSPLRRYLSQHLGVAEAVDSAAIPGIEENIREGLLTALAVISTEYGSGRSVAWVDAADHSSWRSTQISIRSTKLGVAHIMASAALPLFFPAVGVNGSWHGDGGVRLAAPLSPAMHLGARKILAVSPRTKPLDQSHVLQAAEYPSPGQVAGVMLNAIFLDLLDYDAMQMKRINDLVKNTPQAYWNGLRPVDVMVLRPRRDLGEVARQFDKTLPRAFRFFKGGFAGKAEPTADALSMVNFEGAYLKELMSLGEEDTRARIDEVRAFLEV